MRESEGVPLMVSSLLATLRCVRVSLWSRQDTRSFIVSSSILFVRKSNVRRLPPTLPHPTLPPSPSPWPPFLLNKPPTRVRTLHRLGLPPPSPPPALALPFPSPTLSPPPTPRALTIRLTVCSPIPLFSSRRLQEVLKKIRGVCASRSSSSTTTTTSSSSSSSSSRSDGSS